MNQVPPPPIPLSDADTYRLYGTQWMTSTEVDTFQVKGAVPPPPLPLESPARAIINAAIATERERRAPPPPLPLARPVLMMDTECYRDYWSIGFMNDATGEITEFEFYPGTRLDVAGVDRMMRSGTIVGFNTKKYDDPMIALALTGADNLQLKYASDAIIMQNLQPWGFEQQFGVKIPLGWDSVDLIDVMPGVYSLKMYGGKMNSKKIQDLPIDPSASIAPEQRAGLRTYRNNDLVTTQDAYHKFLPQITLRGEMSKQYNVELRSKSDAQIAEAVIKSELGFYIEKPNVPPGTEYRYKTADFIRFHTPLLRGVLQMVENAVFFINPKYVLTMPAEVTKARISIGTSTYKFGIGGLHSTESKVFHLADDFTGIKDHDVAGYYPEIIKRCGLYPQQMGPAFLTVYKKIVQTRREAKASGQAAKKAGDKQKAEYWQVIADSLKIVVNGSFGKFGSRYSILYSPDLMMQTTITGQLALLMLIEELEMAGISVISANTDGVVIKCARCMEWVKDGIIADWEKRTSFETEMTEYKAIYSRDVNNYIALKPNGEAKRKGEYAEPIPIGGSWPSPANDICADAVVAYLAHGTPVEQTIRACTDVRKFVTVQGVTGGGVKYHGDEIEAATTIRGKRDQLSAAGWEETFDNKVFTYGNSAPMAMDEAHALAVNQLRAVAPVRKEYLGKAVRWYYAANEPGAIYYKTNGNLVPRSNGAKPLMELPDTLPPDIDWNWYINEAHSHLSNLGLTPTTTPEGTIVWK